MLKLAKDMMTEMFSMNMFWRIWLMMLMFVNSLMPLFFYQQIEAQLTFASFILGASIGVVLFKMQGFTRLLGLMHIPWFPLIYFLIGRMAQIPMNSMFGIWMRVVILLNSISLVIDIIDVIRYLSGDRKRVEVQ